jgi:hypothetical protein
MGDYGERNRMLNVSFFKVREDQIDQLRAWGRELTRRTDEVKETYTQEGVSHEASYLIETKRGWILVFAVELEDREKARAAYRASTLPIDCRTPTCYAGHPERCIRCRAALRMPPLDGSAR